VKKLGSGSLFRDLPLQPSVPLAAQQGLSLLLEMAGEEEKQTPAKGSKRSCSFCINKTPLFKKGSVFFSKPFWSGVLLGA